MRMPLEAIQSALVHVFSLRDNSKFQIRYESGKMFYLARAARSFVVVVVSLQAVKGERPNF